MFVLKLCRSHLDAMQGTAGSARVDLSSEHVVEHLGYAIANSAGTIERRQLELLPGDMGSALEARVVVTISGSAHGRRLAGAARWHEAPAAADSSGFHTPLPPVRTSGPDALFSAQ